MLLLFMFIELGPFMPDVAAISGHKGPMMQFRYTQLRPADLVVRLDALATEVVK